MKGVHPHILRDSRWRSSGQDSEVFWNGFLCCSSTNTSNCEVVRLDSHTSTTTSLLQCTPADGCRRPLKWGKALLEDTVGTACAHSLFSTAVLRGNRALSAPDDRDVVIALANEKILLLSPQQGPEMDIQSHQHQCSMVQRWPGHQEPEQCEALAAATIRGLSENRHS